MRPGGGQGEPMGRGGESIVIVFVSWDKLLLVDELILFKFKLFV